MMKSEFEKIAGYTVNDDTYKIIETAYYMSTLDKVEFIQTLNRHEIEEKKPADVETVAMIENSKKEIENSKKEIAYYNDRIKLLKEYIKISNADEIKDFKQSIKTYKRQIEINKKWIARNKFFLGI